jgi:D-galactarolactone cycloisomerase
MGDSMKIQDICTYPLRSQLNQRFCYSQKWFTHRTALLVKVVTDDGVIGWGEVFCHDAPWAIASLIDRTYKPLLIGKNPLDIAVIWDFLYNWTKDYGQKGLTTAAISGIDIALWDIFGKVMQQPISQLLGGLFRAQVQGYATGMYGVDDPDPAARIAEEAARYAEKGFLAMKMKVGFGLQEDLRRVRAVRETIGDQIQLMIDANHAYDASTAIRLGRALEAYDIAWFEEPVSPEDLDGYREVRRALSIPIAGGEAEFTRYGFRDLLAGGSVDIVQPDICLCGGISEGKKIADLARTWHVRCLPHVWGTNIGLAAALHFMGSLPDTPPSLNPMPMLVELDQTEHPLRNLTLEPIPLVDGYVQVPQGPGLGVEVDEDLVAKYRLD